jgi:hypothetical protein
LQFLERNLNLTGYGYGGSNGYSNGYGGSDSQLRSGGPGPHGPGPALAMD